MKRLLMAFILGMFIINFVNAVDGSSYVFKQNTDVDLKIPAFDTNNVPTTSATTCNLTLRSPNMAIVINNEQMDWNAGGIYNLSISSSKLVTLGTYYGSMSCSDGTNSGFSTFNVDITPSGNSGSSNIVFFVLVILVLYAITFIGFFGRNIPVTILGGMAMLGLGLYTIRNGIIIYQDWITNYFSYVTMGIGGILGFWAIFEWFDETFN
jgi:hypothetical protein